MTSSRSAAHIAEYRGEKGLMWKVVLPIQDEELQTIAKQRDLIRAGGKNCELQRLESTYVGCESRCVGVFALLGPKYAVIKIYLMRNKFVSFALPVSFEVGVIWTRAP